MVRRVYEQALKAKLDEVIIATDHEEVYKEARSFEGNVIMTSDYHNSGTERCAEAVSGLGGYFDVVINIQCDEPFMEPNIIQKLALSFENNKIQIATIITELKNSEALQSPNTVKVVKDIDNCALYFSRSVIPYQREKSRGANFYRHLGMYAYRTGVLREIVNLPVSFLEQTEALEQLRWLENGYKIELIEVDSETISIDTIADLKLAEAYLQDHPELK